MVDLKIIYDIYIEDCFIRQDRFKNLFEYEHKSKEELVKMFTYDMFYNLRERNDVKGHINEITLRLRRLKIEKIRNEKNV